MCVFDQEEPITKEVLEREGWKCGKVSPAITGDHVHMYLIRNYPTNTSINQTFSCSVLYTFSDGTLFAQYIVRSASTPILIKTGLVTMNDINVAVEYGKSVIKDILKNRFAK